MSASPASTRVRIDPRIKRRRIEVLRSEGRKRLRNFTAAIGVVALAAGAVGATRSPLLDVDYVDVTGIEHTPRQELLAVTGLDAHPLLIDLDTEALAAAARRLPWVATAKAVKEWPGTVRLEVTERVVRAVVRTETGQWALADVEGRILEVVPERPPGVPAISKAGLPGAPGTALGEAGAAPLVVAAALPEGVRDKVGEVVAAEGGTIELNLWPSGTVRLGPPDQLPAKMDALATMLTKADLRRLAVLDLRVPSAPVLTRR